MIFRVIFIVVDKFSLICINFLGLEFFGGGGGRLVIVKLKILILIEGLKERISMVFILSIGKVVILILVVI